MVSDRDDGVLVIEVRRLNCVASKLFHVDSTGGREEGR